MSSLLLKDMYAQELRFNLNGKNEVTSYSGICLSVMIRAFVLVCLVERLIAWQSLGKFKFDHYDAKMDFSEGEYTAENTNF